MGVGVNVDIVTSSIFRRIHRGRLMKAVMVLPLFVHFMRIFNLPALPIRPSVLQTKVYTEADNQEGLWYARDKIVVTQMYTKMGIASGWWDDRKRNHKPVLPIYRLNVSNNLSHALPCLRLPGHNFLVQRMRHNSSRRPYELRICDKCDWHSVQDEEHNLLDCPHEHLVSLRTQQRQLVFPPQYEDSQTRLRTFLNHPGIYGVASFVAECLALSP